MSSLGIKKTHSNSVNKRQYSPMARDNSPHKKITAEQFKLSKYLHAQDDSEYQIRDPSEPVFKDKPERSRSP